MRPTHIIIHHSKSADGPRMSWAGIRRYHTVGKGWRDIGYHYGIEIIDGECEVLVGRLMTTNGAHCTAKHMNVRSLGVCVVGDFDLAVPSVIRWNVVVALVTSLVETIHADVGDVLGHGEVDPIYANGAPRTCPGKMFDMHRFRADLRFALTQPRPLALHDARIVSDIRRA